MTEQIKEAILLAGGNAWRLKPDIWVPKPMLQLNKWTLLEYQLRWLIQHKFNHIIIASDKEYSIKPVFNEFVTWSIEKYKVGTGGAVLLAIDKLETNSFYLMNVDDLCFYNPIELTLPDTQARILVSKPRIGFGRVELRQDLVLGFKEKPLLDFYCSAGHYFFKKHIIDSYFPDTGNFEDKVLPELAKRRILEAYRLRGTWITINTAKDYMQVREMLSQENNL
jgi:NDP-sugar pyrophosphorylase family protein